MRINTDLDDKLVTEAMAVTGLAIKNHRGSAAQPRLMHDPQDIMLLEVL